MIHRTVPRLVSACPQLQSQWQRQRRRQWQRLPSFGLVSPQQRQHQQSQRAITKCFSSAPEYTNTSQSEFEERHHLAKQLSRPTENTKLNQKSWSATVKKFDSNNQKSKDWYKNKPLIGLQHCSPAKYEHEGLAEIHSRSYDAPVLLEIRDVRVPASSHHPSFTRLARHRVHLICYTHADLIDAPTRDKVERWTGTVWPESMCIFVDTRDSLVVNKGNALGEHYERLYDGLLKQIEGKGSNAALTVGVPNVGKSCVLMALLRFARERGFIPKQVRTAKNDKKKGKRTWKTAKGSMPGILDTPGKTRTLTEYLLREKPRAYFLDVPGITPPHFFFEDRPEAWYGYGATNLLPLLKGAAEDVEVQRAFCEYVLYCANRDGIFHYVDKLNLDGPTEDLDEALAKVSNKHKNLREEKWMLKKCQTFLKLFNTGNFGPLILDDLRDLEWKPFQFRDDHFQDRERDH